MPRAGGPEQGHKHLLDANIDWGQDLLELKRWSEANPDTRPLHLAYFGWVVPSTAGLATEDIPRIPETGKGTGSVNDVTPGWYAVSVNHLMGYRHYESDRPVYTWLQNFDPVDRAGYSIWIFRLDVGDVASIREKSTAIPPSH